MKSMIIFLAGCGLLLFETWAEPVKAHEEESVSLDISLQVPAGYQQQYSALWLGIYAVELVPCKHYRQAFWESLSPISSAYANHGMHFDTPTFLPVQKAISLLDTGEQSLTTATIPHQAYCRVRMVFGHSGSTVNGSNYPPQMNRYSVHWQRDGAPTEGVEFAMVIEQELSEPWMLNKTGNGLRLIFPYVIADAIEKSAMAHARDLYTRWRREFKVVIAEGLVRK